MRIVAVVDALRDIIGGVGQVGEELLDLVEGILFGFGFVVDLAALVDVNGRAAQFLLVERLTDGATYDGRPGGEDLRLTLDHDSEVRQQGEGSRRAGDGAHDACGDRHLVEQVEVAPPGLTTGQRHAALFFIALR